MVERSVDASPVKSCFYARKVLERVVHHVWAFRQLGDTERMPLAELTKDRRFEEVVRNQTMLTKMKILRRAGNDAAHADGLEGNPQPITRERARSVAAHLYDIMVWAARYHSAQPELAPAKDAVFRPQLLGQTNGAGNPGGAGPGGSAGLPLGGLSQAETAKRLKEIERKEKELDEQRLLLDAETAKQQQEREQHAREVAEFERRRREDELAAQLAADSAVKDAEAKAEAARIAKEESQRALAAEIVALRAKLAEEQEKRGVDTGVPTPPLAISEAETRLQLIDPMLESAGFAGDSVTRELELRGMPNTTGTGFADYVLWDDDRKPLAVVEAKKSMEHMSVGAEQVRLYADCIEKMYGQRPVMFCTNGFHTDIIDDAANLPGSGVGYPAREVEGFPTAKQLRTMIARRTRRQRLAEVQVDPAIAGAGGRSYQLEAIRAVTETLEERRHRHALLVMATGTGKTRVAVAMAKVLRQGGWVGKVLFLADRTALVTQAHKAFQSLYPEATPVNLLEHPQQVGDVYVSTYNTMMGLVGEDGDKAPRFKPFDFDLIIVDEAHRSVYNRFGRLLDHFDAYVVGLTATPKSEIGHDTYALFNLADKTPTYEYGLDEAVKEGNLVPFHTVVQDSLFLRRGMEYEGLTAEEKLAWDKADWGTDEDGNEIAPPAEVSPAEINRVLYNRDTIRQVLKTVVERGIRVGGDQLGKTIIFARSQKHAELIKEIFDESFPEYSRAGASVITNRTKYPQSALDRFANPEGDVNVAVSVDMLDTGVDVPEVVNLVFFKPVYSPSKFWQMVGRGTRLRSDLFGPGLDKEYFLVFDFCDNLPHFLSGEAREASTGRPRSLSQKLFDARVGLLYRLDPEASLRAGLADDLHGWTAGVEEGNIMVRPGDREILRRFKERAAWDELSEQDVIDLRDHVAHLPLGTMDDSETAKRFDLVVLKLQLGLLEPTAEFPQLRQRMEKIADDLLAVRETIPTVKEREGFLERVVSPEWWKTVTAEELEDIRVGLRDLIQFVPKGHRNVVTFDIADEMGEVVVSEGMPELPGSDSLPSHVEERLRQLLQEHANDLAMIKLRTARPLNAEDVSALEAMVADAGLAGVDELRAQLGGDSIPAFIRRLVGLDPEAMRAEFADLMDGSTLSASQIRFVRTIVDVLVHNGGVEYKELFQAPFDEEGNLVDIFEDKFDVVIDLKTRLQRIEQSAQATS